MGAGIWQALTRRKVYDTDTGESKLARVLTLLDLTALGVGSTLGLGVYVLAGSVAYEEAGPAVTISFLIAAIASSLAGVCYAEFATRVPKAGSAYVYSYVTIGEFVAFTIGWNLILEYVIGTSSVARGLSGYLDTLVNGTISSTLRSTMPIDVSFLAEYPDFFACIVICVLTALLAFGVKESSLINNIFTGVNLITIAIVLIVGGMYADPHNWAILKEEIPKGIEHAGEGGFMPFGVAGIMAGAAKCFYGFVGFDCIATTGEEAINPKRNIPLSIIISLIVIFLAYFGISTVLTMMVPYYLQDAEAPFPKAFEALELYEIKWIVTIGAVFALCTSLLGAMFPLPRVIYSMSNDGIIFKRFKTVNSYTKTPLSATILSGFLAAIMALMFNLHQLIDMMSIGTLLAYTIVAICVLVLRYQNDDDYDQNKYLYNKKIKLSKIVKQFFNINNNDGDEPTNLTSTITKISIVIFSILAALVCVVLKVTDGTELFSIVILSIIIIFMLLTIIVIWRQPISKIELTFKVPLIPILPCVSVFFNLYLMFQLDVYTWIRFIVWLIIGYLIYFAYGMPNSEQGKRNSNNEIATAGVIMSTTKNNDSQKITFNNLNSNSSKYNNGNSYYTNNAYVDTEIKAYPIDIGSSSHKKSYDINK
ncbi:cationic amino acid transporter 3 [Condylostylus longicornis]|uniref:cationic amino acid transporter 3 n=1 Tax=Condylostylus longicornis TaxID=2530218 RepID=UPI00244E23F7|nr:cationic amino acid transporter 3 [Condylostylus longicornis]XP_055384235.1 cationic amino acid transporter 3 [Condylostylus longicornis]